MNALDVLCAQLTRDLFAIGKFLSVLKSDDCAGHVNVVISFLVCIRQLYELDEPKHCHPGRYSFSLQSVWPQIFLKRPCICLHL